MRQNDLLYINAELNSAERRQVQRRVVAGELNRVLPGIASPLPKEDWPGLFKREKSRVLAALFPGAVVAYRSAFDGLQGDTVYLTAAYAREVELPGLKVVLSKGPGVVAGDSKIQGRELYFPGRERMLLDAMAPAPRVDDPAYSRKINAQELEDRLISICDSRGEANFTKLRGQIQAVAAELQTPKTRINELDALMGAILGTRPEHKMSTTTGTGRARGYDAARMDLFQKLVNELKVTELPRIQEVTPGAPDSIHFAFLESYFSNFIEGTEFEINEARAIAMDGKISPLRSKDSHDIKGVFDQAVGAAWRARGITDIHSFERVLRERHELLMTARPEVYPGEFKTERNVAGNTTFVDPNLVVGTLREAGLLLHDVEAGMPRALLAMFIVTEVHPFNDGNGRLARLVMNSELSAAGEARIIVPTLYREEYLDCLREITRASRIKPYLAAMTTVQDWSAAFSYADLDKTIESMKQCNAFEKSLNKHRLLWPDQADGQELKEDGTEQPHGDRQRG